MTHLSLPSIPTGYPGGPTDSLGSNYLVDPDVQLMLRVREGDDAAFAALVERHQARLVRLLAHLSGDPEIAEDLAQDVFLRVYRARGRYEPTARFTTYLFRVATNVALNSKRTKSRRKERVIAEGSRSSAAATPIQQAADKSTTMPARQADSKEVQDVVKEAVERLPERQRIALLLHKFEELSYADIATSMELTPSAVKSLLSRARQTLRGELDHYMRETGASPASRATTQKPLAVVTDGDDESS